MRLDWLVELLAQAASLEVLAAMLGDQRGYSAFLPARILWLAQLVSLCGRRIYLVLPVATTRFLRCRSRGLCSHRYSGPLLDSLRNVTARVGRSSGPRRHFLNWRPYSVHTG